MREREVQRSGSERTRSDRIKKFLTSAKVFVSREVHIFTDPEPIPRLFTPGPRRPTYHLYGEAAGRARLPIDQVEANKLADDVLAQYFAEQSPEQA